MDYTTWTRDYNESKTTTSKIVTAVYDMFVIVYVRDNKILCNKMFDTVLNISSLNIYAKNVVEIEKHFLQGRDLEDRLEINHGNMKTIRRQTFVDLRIRLLLLESNNIMRIENEAFVNLSRLEQVNLSRNKLKELNWESFVGLPKLKTFFSSLNRISKLQKNAFQFLQSDNASIVLNGNSNVIETVEQEVFSELTIGIDTLDLSVNKIKILPAGVFKGSCFLKVDLSDNKYSTHLSRSF
jgi:Leucine-rich repeat (LRR) protein